MIGPAVRPIDRLEAARLLLRPATIAVAGASEDLAKFGGRLYRALVDHGFAGRLYPINPKRRELLGRPAYPDWASLPETPDVAVVVLPPAQALAAVEGCAARGVPAAIVISSGFAETGEEGRAYQEALTRIARSTGPRLLGPNCLGLVNPHDGVVACASVALAHGPLLRGGISMVSHSGALQTTILSRAQDQGIGFRSLVSTGNEADLDVCDFLDVFLDDPATRAVALFLEHIRRPARFRQLARRAQEIGKPIVALKVGRSAAGVRMARSHTAAIAGDDAAVDAVFRSDGIIRVNSLEALLATAQVLAVAPTPPGPGVVILGGSGGGCGVLADLAADAGLRLARFSESTRSALASLYEPAALSNPLDVGGMRPGVPLFHPAPIRACLEEIARDPNVHGLIFALTTMAYVADIARCVVDFARRWDRPVLVYGGVGSANQDAVDAVRAAGLPVIPDAEHCIRAAAALMNRSSARPVRSTPPTVPPPPTLPAGEGPLSEVESKRVLAAWGLPLPREALAVSAEVAARLAEAIGGPVAMKVVSPDVAHKTDVGGVQLGILGTQPVRDAYEVILGNVRSSRPDARVDGVLVQEMVGGVEVIVGSKRDPQFGPVVLVGLGGIFVELLGDVAIRPAPVAVDVAHEMLAELRGYPLLAGFRGTPPADLDALAELVASFSALAAALADQVETIDLNPVVVLPKGQGARIVDALIVRGLVKADHKE